MAKSRQQKEETVKSLSEKLGRIKGAVFTNFDGLNVNESNELRNLLRENQIDYTVAKKTLLKLAFKKASLDGIDVKKIAGAMGLALGYEDEIAAAKTLSTFAAKHPTLKLIGGIYNGSLIDAAEVKALALLPGKDDLRAKLVWLFNYPRSGWVNVLAGNLKSLVYALQAIKDKKS